MIELLTGDAIFQTHDNLEHLAMMQAVIGLMPDSTRNAALAGQSSSVLPLFKRGRLNWPDGADSKRSVKAVSKIRPLAEHLRAHADSSIGPYLDSVTGAIHLILSYLACARIFLSFPNEILSRICLLALLILECTHSLLCLETLKLTRACCSTTQI